MFAGTFWFNLKKHKMETNKKTELEIELLQRLSNIRKTETIILGLQICFVAGFIIRTIAVVKR